MRLHEELAKSLAALDTSVVFAYVSDDVATLAAELKRLGVCLLTTRHEHAAVGMADGFSRFSGRLGVALVGRGPGLTNCLNALVTASRAGSCVLVLTGAESAGPPDPSGRPPIGK
jgi:acetolactate synthase-1/2/3 large subunit